MVNEMKKFKFKRLISIITSALLLTSTVTLFGCSKENATGKFVEKASEFEFVACWFNDYTKEEFKAVKECGFDMVQFNPWQTPVNQDRTVTAVDNAKAEGLPVILHLKNTGEGNVNGGPDADKELYEIDYSKNDNVKLICMFDEPWYDAIDNIAGWIDKYEKTFTDKTFYVNLYPEYVSKSQLNGHTWEEYIEHFCDAVLSKLSGERWLCYDIYPYLMDDTTQVVKGIEPTWLHSLAVMAENAKKVENAHFKSTIQSCSYAGHREPAEEDIRQQIYVSMAFGAERLTCYTYAVPPGSESIHGEGKISMVDRKGNPTHIYYSVQKLIKEVKAFDEIYLQYQYDGFKTYLANESFDSENYNASFKRVSKMELAELNDIDSVYCTADTIISQLFNKKGDNAYMVVNYEDPIEKITDSVILSVKDSKKVTVIKKGVSQTVELKEGVLTLELEPGEGAMVIPE